MTYLQASGGGGPTQETCRVLLNNLAVLPPNQPLRGSLMLAAALQNPSDASYPADGLAPTLTTTPRLWCM